MEIVKIILKDIALAILMLIGLFIIFLIPNALTWLSTQIGYITTIALLIFVIWIIAQFK